MIKITDLTEVRFRTTYHKDAFGNRIRGKEEYTAKRTVRTVKAGTRFGHAFIDSIVFQILSTFIQFLLSLVILVIGSDNPIGLAIDFISDIGILLLYPLMYFICEYYWQQTPGKFLTQTVTINEYGDKPDVKQIALRSLIRLIPFEPFSCLGGKYSYGWHDKWSNTFVVEKEELRQLQMLQKEQDLN